MTDYSLLRESASTLARKTEAAYADRATALSSTFGTTRNHRRDCTNSAVMVRRHGNRADPRRVSRNSPANGYLLSDPAFSAGAIDGAPPELRRATPHGGPFELALDVRARLMRCCKSQNRKHKRDGSSGYAKQQNSLVCEKHGIHDDLQRNSPVRCRIN
jgi:hypothetical protein